MGIFDQEEETRDAAGFDEESKIRLFETQQRSSKSIHDYVKKFLPFAVAAVVIVAGAIWMMQPGVGSKVRAPYELQDAVYEHMLTKEKRTAKEMDFFWCGDAYWVKVVAEQRSYPPSNPYDPVNQYRLSARPSDSGPPAITTLPLPSREDDVPCKQ